jgi:SAM-dependent methyltransferase
MSINEAPNKPHTRVIGALRAAESFAGVKAHFDESQLLECQHCGLWFRSPQKTEQELLALYMAAEVKVWSQTSTSPLWRRLHELIAIERPQAVLDVGCFAGDFLRLMPLNCEKMGVEPSELAAAAAERAGVKILGSSLNALTTLHSCDVICALDVIEHVPDPAALLVQLCAQVKPGGVVVLLTGVTDSPAFRRLAPRYWYCEIIEHIVFINKSWCERVAKKNNLELERYEAIASAKIGFVANLLMLVKAFAYSKITPMVRRFGFLSKIPLLAKIGRWDYSPFWNGAKDHAIIIFRTPGTKL